MAESGGQNDCILFSTADWDTPCWTNKQHMARHLARRGYRVLYVETIGLRAPMMTGSDLGRVWRRLVRGLRYPRLAEPGVWVMSPLVFPFKHHWRIVRSINQGLMRWLLGRFVRRTGFEKPLVWTYHPFILESVQGISARGLVYHCVDDLSAIPGVDVTAFNREEQRLLARADVVFTTSDALQEKCQKHNAKTYYFPNVADLAHFGQAREAGDVPADLADIPRPRLGYVGVLSAYKVDFSMIYAIAHQRPGWHWVLIGEKRAGETSKDLAALARLPNVHFLGFRAYSELPSYLRGLDVATLPTLVNEYTKSMFPMKYFEYLAAGLRIVSTPLEFTKRFHAFTEIGSGTQDFMTAIVRQLERGRLSDSESADAMGDNTWDKRLDKMLALLGMPMVCL